MLRCVVVFIFATVCFALTEDSVSIIVEDSTRLIDGESFPSYYFRGNGINWKDVGGIMGLVIPENQPFNVVYTNNLTSEETIIHAHGLTPPSPLDGVPYISSVPIFPGRSVHYEYNLDPIANQGTYYIHSHYGFQLGNGALAPLIIQGTVNGYPLNSLINQSIDLVMMLEDLCPHATGEYLEKRAFAEEQGFAIPREDIDRDRPEGAGDCSSWKTFLELAYDFTTTWYTPDGFSCSALEAATDSDVAYQKYLANGFTYRSPAIVSNIDFSVPIRYRVINGGGMTNFQLKFPFTVTLISMDGQWVNPYQNDTFWISVAQRLDFLIQVPQSYNSSYFTVTAWTENYKSSIPTPLIVSNLNTVPEKEHETIQSSVREYVESLQYATGMMDNHLDLLVTAFTPLEQRVPDLVEKVLLTGDNGFRGINHHSYRLPPTAPLPYVPNPNPIIVRYGQRVQFQIQNQNADGHPMHLHGHSFQITNIDGTDLPQGPMRDVAFVPGGCHNVTIEFEALNPGLWVFHCHLEFHQTAGMLTTVEYFI